MQLGEAGHEGQPDPGPRTVGGARGPLAEGLEDLGPEGRRDPRTVVLHRDQHAAGLRSYLDPDGAVGPRVPGRVHQQVLHDPLHLGRVHDGRHGVRPDLDAAVGQNLQALHGPADQGPHVRGPVPGGDDAALQPVDVEEVGEQAVELPGVGRQAGQQVAAVGRVHPLLLLQREREAQDRREGAAELVGDGCQERVLHLVQGPEALGGLPFPPLALPQGLLRELELREVVHHPLHGGRATGVVREDHGVVPDPHHPAVRAHDPVLLAEAPPPADALPVLGHGPGPVLRVQVLLPAVGLGQVPLGGDAQDLLDLRAHVDRLVDLVGSIDVQDGRQLLDERPVALLGRTELLLGLLPMRDVEADPLPVPGPAGLVPHQHGLVPDPHDVAPGVEHPVLDQERLPGAVGAEVLRPDPFPVLRVDGVPVRLPVPGIAGVAQDRLDLGAHVGRAAHQVLHVDDGRELLDERAVAGLRLPHQRLRPLAVGDVADHDLARRVALPGDGDPGHLDVDHPSVEADEALLEQGRHLAVLHLPPDPGEDRLVEGRVDDPGHGLAEQHVGPVRPQQLGGRRVGEDEAPVAVDEDRVGGVLHEGAVPPLLLPEGPLRPDPQADLPSQVPPAEGGEEREPAGQDGQDDDQLVELPVLVPQEEGVEALGRVDGGRGDVGSHAGRHDQHEVPERACAAPGRGVADPHGSRKGVSSAAGAG